MVNVFKKTLLSSILVVLTTSCSDNSDKNTNEPAVVESDSINESKSINIEKSIETVDYNKQAQIEEVSIKEEPQIEDITYDLSEYQDLNKNDDFSFMTGIYTVQNADELSTEKKLSFLGPLYFEEDEYYTERNTFKKKKLAESLLPKIESKIDSYKNEYRDGFRVKIPIIYEDVYGGYNENNGIYIAAKTFRLNNFDFEKNYFPIETCYNAHTNQGFLIIWKNDILIESGTYRDGTSKGIASFPDVSDAFPKEAVVDDKNNSRSAAYCGLSVNDEEKAIKIEDAILDNNITAKGFVYYNVPIHSGKHSISFEPVLADITYYSKDDKKVLANKQFTW